jgi:hypothetical protein
MLSGIACFTSAGTMILHTIFFKQRFCLVQRPSEFFEAAKTLTTANQIKLLSVLAMIDNHLLSTLYSTLEQIINKCSK